MAHEGLEHPEVLQDLQGSKPAILVLGGTKFMGKAFVTEMLGKARALEKAVSQTRPWRRCFFSDHDNHFSPESTFQVILG